MTDIVIVDAVLVFIKWMLPVIAVLSLVLSLKPGLFMDLEKKLSKELVTSKSNKKSIALLEKENLILHNALQRNNQIVGLLCFVLTIVIINRIY